MDYYEEVVVDEFEAREEKLCRAKLAMRGRNVVMSKSDTLLCVLAYTSMKHIRYGIVADKEEALNRIYFVGKVDMMLLNSLIDTFMKQQQEIIHRKFEL